MGCVLIKQLKRLTGRKEEGKKKKKKRVPYHTVMYDTVLVACLHK